MTMTPEEARAIERAPVRPGESRPFYCEIQQNYEPAEKRLSRFTGQCVTVVRHLGRDDAYDGPGPDDSDDDFDVSRMFAVQAKDGTEFHAYVEELNGWDYDLGQFFWPDGTYGPDHDTRFLANERSRPDIEGMQARVTADIDRRRAERGGGPTRFLANERSEPAAFRATVQIDLEAEDENDAAEKAWHLAHEIENMPDVTNVWVESVN